MKSQAMRFDELDVSARFTEAVRFQSWLAWRWSPSVAGRPEAVRHEIVRKACLKYPLHQPGTAGKLSLLAQGDDMIE
jgi:hypothetical protein